MGVVRQCAAAYPAEAVWLLAALEDIQARLGFVPADAIALLADRFGMSQAEVRNLVKGSDAFRDTPPAPHLLHVCLGPLCAAAGGHDLLTEAKAAMDGRNDVDCTAGHCLGCCDDAPAIMLDGIVRRDVRPEHVRRLLCGLSGEDDG